MASSKELIIVLTGVTRGIGNGMAEYYLSQGHTVIGCGRSKDKIAFLREKYKDVRADFDVVDVSKEGEVEIWTNRVLQEFGSPTFLINCAGILKENKAFWDLTSEEFDEVIDVNIKGVANVLRHFIPAMLQAKKGIIVNFSSGAGLSGRKFASPYCTSKFGIEGLSQTIALELPEPLACVSFDPGNVNTYMLKIYFEGRDNRKVENECPVEKWVKVGCPLLLGLTRADNGTQVKIPKIQ